jgi:ribosomal protein S18 acetylase RimI-like enzyme
MPLESPIAERIPSKLRLSAAERLVSTAGRKEAAKRLIASAPAHGIDLDLMWGVLGTITKGQKSLQSVRQVALTVLGAGRTAMVFLSHPTQSDSLGTQQEQIKEIAISIEGALDGLRDHAPDQVTLAQTLIETDQTWAHKACEQAGMISVGCLDYMRKRIVPDDLLHSSDTKWPEGITVRSITTLDPLSQETDYHNLVAALESSYIDTLDCPELCGIRSMGDVVDSHKATGEFAPSRWHLIYKDDQPAGCCLLTHCIQSHSVELVYLGIAPQARGLGLGRSVLQHAISRLGPIGIKEVTCAVDDRNSPAIEIYKSLGFEKFDARIGFVSPIAARS